MNKQEKFQQLLEKYITDSLEPGELNELFGFIEQDQYDEMLGEHILQQTKEDLSMANLPAHRAQEIMRQILHSEKTTARLIPDLSSRKPRPTLLIAIAATFLLAATLLTIWPYRRGDAKKSADLITLQNSKLAEKVNTEAQPLRLRLDDGTTVILQPGAKLDYPNHFLSSKREVSLEGEAFFQVVRQAGRPFYVYHNRLVTQVLGTSFTIRSDDNKKEVEVDVLTGRVAVYENIELPKTGGKTKTLSSSGVILTPNQRVIYHEDNRQFVPSLVAIPLPIQKEDTTVTKSEKKNGFVEEQLPLILSLLQEKYGIEIVVENENLNKCLFTGDIKEESLYDQLDIICTSLNATYETKGTKILIKGNGCQ